MLYFRCQEIGTFFKNKKKKVVKKVLTE